MGPPNKILTVAYGTFSCTLEGFDDPFSAMTDIAEYFRDLAAEDRFFGAEPPVPDMAMLRTIAETRAKHAVRASPEKGGIVLRPSADAAGEAPAEVEPVSAPLADLVHDHATPSEAVASMASGLSTTIGAVLAEDVGPLQQGFDEERADMEGAPSDDDSVIDAVEAAEVVLAGRQADGSEGAVDTTAQVDIAANGPSDDDVPSPEADAMPDPDGVEFRLARIRDAMATEARERETYSEDVEGPPAPMDDGLAAAFSTSIAEDEPSMPEGQAAPAADPLRLEAAVRVDEETRADGQNDSSVTPDSEAQRPAPRFVIRKLRRVRSDPSAEQAVEDGAEIDVLPALSARDEAPEEEPLLLQTEMPDEDPAVETASILDLPDPDFADEDDDLAKAIRQAAGSDSILGDLDTEPEEAPERRSMSGDSAADLASFAEARMADDAPRGHDADAPSDPDMERLFAATDSRLTDEDASRRQANMSHLKAAVAARRADGPIGPAPREDASDAYRADLASTVRPRRPTRPTDGHSARPERPGPLMLVSEQRVAGAAIPGGETGIRPRRPHRLSEDGSQDAAPLAHDPAGSDGFERFVTETGATGLSDTLEAAAVYTTRVLGQSDFSRPHLLQMAASTIDDLSREDGLRGFGQLLRGGTIRKVSRGTFALAIESRFGQTADRRAG